MPFVHLHNHSEYSLLDGLNKIDILVNRAVELGMDAIALTDHGFMYGVVEFYEKCKAKGIKPIIGCELYVAGRSMLQHENKEDALNYHIILLAKDWKGYQNLCKLASRARIDGFYYKPRVDIPILKENHEGLICLSACIKGHVPALLLDGKKEEAWKIAGQYKEIFGADFYLEVQNHGLPEELKVLPMLKELGQALDIKLVATQDAHYPKQKDAFAHDILLCIQTLSDYDDPTRLRFSNDQFYIKSEEEMRALFPDMPEVIDQTDEIAQKCHVDFEFDVPHLPKFEMEGVNTIEERASYLRKLCQDNLPRCYGENPSQEIRDRLEYELGIIESMKFVDYFLVVQDFVCYAKNNGIAVGPGRGSAAGSIVSYLLNITGIDPLQYNLYFERFLNPERISMPDIDIDFEDARRGEVIQYVRRKYGTEKVAQVATFGKMESRAAIRDAARAYKFKMETVNQISKSIPLGFNLQQAYKESPEFAKLIDSSEPNKKLYQTALEIEGITRNFSVHAAGVVIGDEPLWNYVPLTCDKENNIVTQYDKDIVEKMGLLKIDFLGLRNLSTIADCVRLVHDLHGISIDIEKIPFDDAKVFELYQTAKTKGVFQVESRGMRQIMKDLKPSNIEDVIAVIALFRPGPMLLIKDFIRNKFHPGEIVYDHPDLIPILENTYGICVYQEQVMRIAQVMGGFSLGQADILRKAMGKKKKELMEKQKATFLQKAKERGYSKEVAAKVFTNLEYFAGYGFNRAHAAAYGVVSYETAWLKTHYPLEYMTSLLNSVKDDEKKLSEYIEETRELKIEVLGPSINRSQSDFIVEGNCIRYGLLAIKNIGTVPLDLITADRIEKGNYTSFASFLSRNGSSKINKKVIEHLIKAGAFDEFNPNRTELLITGDTTLAPSASLFDMIDPGQDDTEDSSKKKDLDPEIIMNYEKEALGFYLTCHPFSPYKNAFPDIDCTDLANIEEIEDPETHITVFVRIDSVRVPKKKNGATADTAKNQSVIVTASDLTGSVEFIAYGKVMDQLLESKNEPGVFVLELRVRREEDRFRISLQELKRFISRDQMAKESNSSVQFSLYMNMDDLPPDTPKKLIPLLREYPGSSLVKLYITKGDLEIHSEAGFKYRVSRSQALIEKLNLLLGSENVRWRKC